MMLVRCLRPERGRRCTVNRPSSSASLTARLASEWQTPARAASSLRLRSQAPWASHSSEITFRTASSPVVKPAAIAGGNGPVAACSRRRRSEARRSGDRCSGRSLDEVARRHGRRGRQTGHAATGWPSPPLDHLVRAVAPDRRQRCPPHGPSRPGGNSRRAGFARRPRSLSQVRHRHTSFTAPWLRAAARGKAIALWKTLDFPVDRFCDAVGFTRSKLSRFRSLTRFKEAARQGGFSFSSALCGRKSLLWM